MCIRDREKAKTRKGRRRSRHGGISGGVLALLWAVFLILVGVYVYVFFINDKLFTENITGRDNTVRLEIPDGANYRLCTIDEINQLVNNYLLARTKADQTTLQRLFTDPSEFDDMKSIEIAAEYITAYNKTTCYIANGYTACLLYTSAMTRIRRSVLCGSISRISGRNSVR